MIDYNFWRSSKILRQNSKFLKTRGQFLTTKVLLTFTHENNSVTQTWHTNTTKANHHQKKIRILTFFGQEELVLGLKLCLCLSCMNKLGTQISDTQNRALRKIIQQRSAIDILLLLFSCCLMFWVVVTKADSLKLTRTLSFAEACEFVRRRYVTVVNFQEVKGCKEWFVITKTKNSNQFWSLVQQRWSVCAIVLFKKLLMIWKRKKRNGWGQFWLSC